MCIAWRREFEIGVTNIDEQHKELVSSFNCFIKACRDGEENSGLEKMFTFIDDFVVNHFRDEEMIQEKSSYPYFENHKLEHLAFIEKINQIKACFNREEKSELIQIITMNTVLLDWLVKHISGSDRKFGQHLVASGYLCTHR